ncbi:magnesium/cobalt transporter CorA [Bacillus sp. CGMCC 1.16607]|uniref:magnesium/cobalt transporter CorA n=1 Tax=Bacillus sp. CGMCC 1.16607 TaxID=3351842 RepID=UPI00362CDDC1
MIRTVAIGKDKKIYTGIEISKLTSEHYQWYWVDFDQPTDEEISYLHEPFQFHPLAIEDCIHTLQRPKLDYYEDYTFFVTQSINSGTFEKEEVNFFLGENYIVTFHQNQSIEMDDVWQRLILSKSSKNWDPAHVLYYVLDKIVDNYFPLVYQIEDTLNEIDDNSNQKSMEALLDHLFETRHHLLILRHTISPMRDLAYRMLNSQRLTAIVHKKEYFSDIYDHLLKLMEMIEASRELTTDIRDSYLSLNSHETNRVMKVLTIITTIFMPLTFIAGLYGMNFKHMPELAWKYGYFGTLIIMLIIAITMFIWFKKKGWFK